MFSGLEGVSSADACDACGGCDACDDCDACDGVVVWYIGGIGQGDCWKAPLVLMLVMPVLKWYIVGPRISASCADACPCASSTDA